MKRMMMALLLMSAAAISQAATVTTGNPTTTNNDDSCDIGVYPAATLLLPYFEVDINAPATTARTTLFTVVNTTRTPQIANVTLWTDWAYPVLSFDVFLTGYDVQALNVYDIVARGLIAPDKGTSNSTTPGSRSAANTANPNFLQSATTSCNNLFSIIPASLLADVRAALTTGTYSLCGNAKVGGTHPNASGYITVDVVATCSPKLQTDASYFNEILYDNVLTGDYQVINPNPATGNYASGNPLVHIRATPEGGAAGAELVTALPYTFYDRYTALATRKIDRRQPLPSTFASRFIQGGAAAFNTDLQIWREGVTGLGAACADYTNNSQMTWAEIVRFDERENPFTRVFLPVIPPPPTDLLPPASSISSASSTFPPLPGGDVAGWFYLNLNNGGSTAYSATAGRNFTTGSSTTVGPRQNQNWVTLTMFAEGRFSASMDATQLANGCSPSPAVNAPIGPGANVTP